MLDSRPPLPLRFRLWNKVAQYLRADRLRFASLDEEHLHKAAMKETGLTDFGDPYHREGLLTLIESAEKDANLHVLGRAIMHGSIVVYLSNRLLLAEARNQTPEVFQRPLIPPIIIVGLPRSGTTLLHRMLALDPAHRGAPSWELTSPLPSGTPDRRRELADKGDRLMQQLYQGRDRIHYSRIDEPEECVILQGTTFHSWVFLGLAPVYGYFDWYIAQDHLKAYQEYYQLLQVLQAVDPERRLTLKAPAHTTFLPILLHTIPNALIVQTHRDPVPVCSSTCSMIYSLWGMTTASIDIPRMAEMWITLMEKQAATSLTFRETNPGVVYDVNYDRFIADPIGTVRGLYDHFGLTWPNRHEEELEAYVRENPQNKHGVHRYSPEDFGLTNDAIVGRFTEYRRRFGFAE